MSNQLIELLKREQTKLARNTFELAGYYCPMGRLPDQIDFVMMRKRLELLSEGKQNVKDLWPQASESFAAKLASRVQYSTEQMKTVIALAETMDKDAGLTDEQQYEVGLKNSKLYQVQATDNQVA